MQGSNCIALPNKARVMIKSNDGPRVVYDPSNSRSYKPRPVSYANEKRNFMSGNLADMYKKPISKESADQSDNENEDIRKLLKDIEYIGASSMSWKERKQLENKKVVSLGGKATKKHRIPLTVAKPAMKNRKKREQKKMEEDLILGRFVKNASKTNNKDGKLKQEDRVLKTSEGCFRKGVLDVKHLLTSSAPKSSITSDNKRSKGKKNMKGKKGKRKRR